MGLSLSSVAAVAHAVSVGELVDRALRSGADRVAGLPLGRLLLGTDVELQVAELAWGKESSLRRAGRHRGGLPEGRPRVRVALYEEIGSGRAVDAAEYAFELLAGFPEERERLTSFQGGPPCREFRREQHRRVTGLDMRAITLREHQTDQKSKFRKWVGFPARSPMPPQGALGTIVSATDSGKTITAAHARWSPAPTTGRSARWWAREPSARRSSPSPSVTSPRSPPRPGRGVAFDLDSAHVEFRSAQTDWLVVSGSRAVLQGSGTVNGKSGYSFRIGDGRPEHLPYQDLEDVRRTGSPRQQCRNDGPRHRHDRSPTPVGQQ